MAINITYYRIEVTRKKEIKLGNQIISSSKVEKLLRITFDFKLNLKSHLRFHVVAGVSQHMSFAKKRFLMPFPYHSLNTDVLLRGHKKKLEKLVRVDIDFEKSGKQ